MDAIEALMTRRSIRSYTTEPVGEDALDTMLRAAMAAPSAGDEQPWHFVVVRDRATMQRIADVHPHAAMLSQATLCIAVLAEMALVKYEEMWVQDDSAATQNILTAAHALGLGAVWLGVYPRPDRQEAIRNILALPDGVECLGLVSIGHPAEQPEPADRYRAERVHHETW